MKRLIDKCNLSLILILCFFISFVYSQDGQLDVDDLKQDAPKVFIDCDHCDIDYIRNEIGFVNYVWDRREADVHLLVTTQRTGGGGREYTLAFIGQKDYQELQNTLKYFSDSTETDDETRKGLVQIIKLGLAPYVAQTPLCEILTVDMSQKSKPTAVEDKWNFWVFSLGVHSWMNGESQRKSASISGNVSANRVTPESKLRLGLDLDYDKDSYELEGEMYDSTSKRGDFDGLYVRSIDEHWSVGGWISVSSSTYNNINFSYTIHPAVEYNFFPYSESTRRQLRVLYKVGYNYFNYLEETIYEKMLERLWNESLSLNLEFNEPWGTAELGVEGSHYFHDFSKNRLSVNAELNIRILKGLTFDIDANYSITHDQLSLPKGEATLEEILLRRRELASEYDYFFRVGLSYSFGSIFSNVVNPRFGERTRHGRYGRFR
jgi:hypothetical protein